MKQYILKTPIGPLHLTASEKGLCGIHWKKQTSQVVASLDGGDAETRLLAQTVEELQEYFAGQRTSFTVPLDLHGTDFQKKVWGELLKIPYGKTFSYTDIAQRIKNRKAVRAVGSANGRNPVSIIVPCHRVIAADGTLGGYAGGLNTKTRLLDLERKTPRD